MVPAFAAGAAGLASSAAAAGLTSAGLASAGLVSGALGAAGAAAGALAGAGAGAGVAPPSQHGCFTGVAVILISGAGGLAHGQGLGAGAGQGAGQTFGLIEMVPESSIVFAAARAAFLANYCLSAS